MSGIPVNRREGFKSPARNGWRPTADKEMETAKDRRSRKAVYDHFTPVVVWVKPRYNDRSMTEAEIETYIRSIVDGHVGLRNRFIVAQNTPKIEEIKTEFDHD